MSELDAIDGPPVEREKDDAPELELTPKRRVFTRVPWNYLATIAFLGAYEANQIHEKERTRVDTAVVQRQRIEAQTDTLIGDAVLKDSLKVVEARRQLRLHPTGSITADSSVRRRLASEAADDSAFVADRVPAVTYHPQIDYMQVLARDLGVEATMWRTCTTCPPNQDHRWRTVASAQTASLQTFNRQFASDQARLRTSADIVRQQIEESEPLRKWAGVATIVLLAAGALLGLTWLAVDIVPIFAGPRSFAVRLRHMGSKLPEERGWWSLAWQLVAQKTARAIGEVASFILDPSVFWIACVSVGIGIPIRLILNWHDRSAPTGMFVAIWAPVLFLYAAVSFYQRGWVRTTFERRVGTIHGSLAGNIDGLTRLLAKHGDRRLEEREAYRLCIHLLARIRSYAEMVFEPEDKDGLRVTLAVPILEDQHAVHEGVPPVALRVWCYDQPYLKRNWTSFPADGRSGTPRAFVSRRPQVIPSLADVDDSEHHGDHECVSIVCIPVVIGGAEPRCVAVLCLDSRVPYFFDEGTVEAIAPLINPIVNLLALVVVSLPVGAIYEFGD